MSTILQSVTLHPYVSSLLTLASFLCLQYILGAARAARSVLSRVPGPWYAPLTTLHLNYAFARGTIWKNVEESHKIYGPIFRLGPRQIWISDKDAMKCILITTDLPKVTMYSEISRDRSSPGLFGEIRREPHKRLKRFLSPAFTVSYVDNLEFLFSKCLQDLIHRYVALSNSPSSVQNKPVVTDMMNDLHNVALDIMGECSFGKGFGQTNPNKDIELDFDKSTWEKIPSAIFNGMTKRYQFVYVKRFLRRLGYEVEFDWPKEMTNVSEYQYYHTIVGVLTSKAIKAVTEERGTDRGKIRPDLLQHLIDEGQNPATSIKMNVRDVVDQMSEILLAGSETTSGTIACFFLEILRNKSVKEKLLKSLPVLGPGDPILSSKAVRNGSEYEYLEACVKETLRMHPIASEMGRRTGAEPIELMGYLIPPYTVVSASYRELHRNPAHWPDPMRFWPERWLKNRPEGVPPPDLQAYYPFSAGKHSCVGINFAWAEIRMVTANLLTRYDFSELPGQSIDWRQYITMQFEGGSWKVSLMPRYEV